MLYLFKLLLRIVQYLSLIFGFTYIYIDYKGRLVKIYKSAKIYAFIINFPFIILMCRFAFRYIYKANVNTLHPIIVYINIIEEILNVFTFMGFILMRFKEEKLLRKLTKIVTYLQTIYFDKLTQTSLSERITEVFILNIFIVISSNIYTVLNLMVIVATTRLRWYVLPHSSCKYYILTLKHYILFHHGLTLCCVNHYFQKLNNYLKYEPVDGITAQVFLQLSLILKELNVLNGPLIFYVIISLFLENGSFICFILLFYLENHSQNINIWDFYDFIFFCLNIFLYFFICERIKTTSRETGNLLMEYHEGENQKETETLCLGRLVMENDVNICGFFTVDLGALFTWVSSIIILTIILVQSSHYRFFL
ncbi:uncharacterized protein ACRADG_010233 [Cochliomyia hominivorax]